MRPQAVVMFERLMFATLAIGALRSMLLWHLTAAAAADITAHPALLVVLVQGAAVVLLGMLTLLVSRRRSKVAMWVLLAVFVLGFPGFVSVIAHGRFGGTDLLAVAQIVGQLVAYALLFTASAREWMRSGR